MKWKVTRDGKDSYPGKTGISKMNALRQANLFNRWARMNEGRATYGIRPLKEEGALPPMIRCKERDIHAGETLTPNGWRTAGFDSHDPPWSRGRVDF